MKRTLFTVASVLLVTNSVQAQTTPPVGSPLRKQVLDGLRRTIEADVKQKVIFTVSRLSVQGDWALVFAEPTQPSGKPIDFKKTHYKSLIDQQIFDGPRLEALLKKEKGRWTVKAFAIGATDVAWANWTDAPYHAPRAIFPAPIGPK